MHREISIVRARESDRSIKKSALLGLGRVTEASIGLGRVTEASRNQHR